MHDQQTSGEYGSRRGDDERGRSISQPDPTSGPPKKQQTKLRPTKKSVDTALVSKDLFVASLGLMRGVPRKNMQLPDGWSYLPTIKT